MNISLLDVFGMGDWTFSTFFSALFTIVVIDLVLAGDNAIVIAMAARELPVYLRKKAIIWGTVGAIVVRILMTLVVVWLLKIPGLLFVSGLALLWIAFTLLAPDIRKTKAREANVEHVVTLASALKTIIIADTVMGVDNVLGIAGAAQGTFFLVIMGLIISVPIMVWGSTFALQLIEKYSITLYIGAGVLVYTAIKMITSEALLASLLLAWPWFQYILLIVGLLVVLGAGWMKQRCQNPDFMRKL